MDNKLVKKIIGLGIIVLVFILILLLKDYMKNIVLDPQTALVYRGLNTKVTKNDPGIQVPISNARIIDKYAKNIENWNFSCRDESKCTAHTKNSSGMNSYIVTAQEPYMFGVGRFNDVLYYNEFSGNEVFTQAFAEGYGITGTSYTGFFDEKTRMGNVTRTSTGPKGNTHTDPVTYPLASPFTMSSNIKGSDRSGNWNPVNIEEDFGTGGEYAFNYGIWEEYSYSGDSQKYLMMNGPADRKYTIVLSLGARAWRLNTAKDSGQAFNPRYFIDGGEISCTSIKVMGAALDKNCKVAISVSGGGVYDITPVVDVPRYLYTEPKILSIVDTTPNPNAPTTVAPLQ